MSYIPDPKTPTRKQLEMFCPDQETVKLFERLFSRVGVTDKTDLLTLFSLVDEVLTDAGTASAKAQQAIDAISRTPKTRVMQASGDILFDDDTIEIDASLANVTATLPSVAGLAGKKITVVATDVTNNNILASFGAETLPDGTTSFQFLAIPEALSMVANAAETGWVIA